MALEVLETTCCVVGGGPAGIMLGYLLARKGVQVAVLEKHQDFFRDFRGDTVHPSTLEVLNELGLLEEFLDLPHEKVESLGVIVGDSLFDVADFRHVPVTCKFVALMPQWDFLNFLSAKAKRFPSFQLLTATRSHRSSERRRTDYGSCGAERRARDADPCGSRGRLRWPSFPCSQSGRTGSIEHGVPIDVLWFRISRTPGDSAQVLGNVNYGKALILINRSDYFQAGLIIAKGSYDEIKARGIDALRADIRQIAPYLGERVNELHDWEQIKILTVQINRLQRWYRPGLLCIGDAAHAMSPAGGVGINLAIQDAVAAANILTGPLQARRVPVAALAAVQKRREFPTRVTQTIQLFAHRGFARVFENPGPIRAPWQLKAAMKIPGIHRAVGYAVGIGARPEHVREEARGRPRHLRMPTAVFAGIGIAASAVAFSWAAWKAWNRLTEKAS